MAGMLVGNWNADVAVAGPGIAIHEIIKRMMTEEIYTCNFMGRL